MNGKRHFRDNAEFKFRPGYNYAILQTATSRFLHFSFFLLGDIMTDNSCCNSLYLYSQEKILKVIDESEIELSPAAIFQELKKKYPDWRIKPSTVRCQLRRLHSKGKIIQPYPGAYCNKITYGVRFVPLLVHNIALSVQLTEDVLHWERTEVVGGVKVYVCFGSERRKVSGKISCDAGMSKAACLFAVHRWLDVDESHLGHSLPETLIITSFEQNRDYVGCRFDGDLRCVTKEGLFGVIERVNQKDENVIRVEHKVNKAMSFGEFESLLQGGVTGYNAIQLTFLMLQKVDKLTDAVKFLNGAELRNQKVQDAILQWIYKQNDAERKIQTG
jgi:hypothetical protein